MAALEAAARSLQRWAMELALLELAERGLAMTTYVETWKGIAFALGRSERWCRYMAQRTDDPLPVFKVGGIVRLNGTDLEGWLGRQRARFVMPVPVAAAERLKLIA